METQDERISNVPWQIRCSPEQKQFFQQFVAQSGMSAQEIIARSFESFRIQIAEDSPSKKVLLEFDSLIGRLQTMMRSQILVALEQQRQCEDDQKSLQDEKQKYHEYYEDVLTKIEAEFELKKQLFESEAQKEMSKLKEEYANRLLNNEKEFILLMEQKENFESENKALKRDKEILSKQASDALRNYEIADGRIFELNLKVKKLEETILKYEKVEQQNFQLEKDLMKLQVQYDGLVQAEELKREYMEKDLRREFEVKLREMNKEEPHKLNVENLQ